MIEDNGIISNHQLGFSKRHSTIEQAHRLLQRRNEALKNK
jgi:hypothetical protein